MEDSVQGVVQNGAAQGEYGEDGEDAVQDSPRLLTSDEISFILSKITSPQIMIPELRENIAEQIKTMYTHQLSYIKIKPSKIEKLASYIFNKSQRSFFQPGTPVGFNVAESVGQPATQLILNAFHKAGQVGSGGFQRYKEVINPKNPKTLKNFLKNTTMQIHMTDQNYSYEDLYIKSQQFVSVSAFDLLEKNTIIKEEYPFDDMSMYTDGFKEINNYQDLGCGIRLRFDREKIFLYKIPIENIAMAISDEFENTIFSYFFSSQLDCVIDIYPIPEAIQTDDFSSLKQSCSIFENGILHNKLKELVFGNFKDISVALVKTIPVLDIIEEVTEHYVSEEEKSDSLVRVWIKHYYAKKEGVPISKLEDLLELSGYPIVEVDPDNNYYVVESAALDVVKNIKALLATETDILEKSFEETGKLTSSPLFLAGFYNYIKTQGSNLEEVRLDPDVDEFKTISSSVTEIYKVLGIEVARSFIEKEIYDTFTEANEYIAPRNIEIISDWMTASGRPVAVNTKSVPKAESSIIRSICFENPKDNIVKGAVLGTEEEINNVSARILFGVQQSLGTGAFKVKEDPEIVKLYNSFATERSSVVGSVAGSVSGSVTGPYRLTSNTLKMAKDSVASTAVSSAVSGAQFKGLLPEAESSLFGSDISKKDDIFFDI